MTVTVPPRGFLAPGADGVLAGVTSRYEKELGDMVGVYRDEQAYRNALAREGAGQLDYRVEEHRNASGAGALTIGLSTLLPGETVRVPGHWVHRSVNVGGEPLVTLFCYAAAAGQDYGLIRRAGGMSSLVVADGANRWTTRPDPDHTGC